MYHDYPVIRLCQALAGQQRIAAFVALGLFTFHWVLPAFTASAASLSAASVVISFAYLDGRGSHDCGSLGIEIANASTIPD